MRCLPAGRSRAALAAMLGALAAQVTFLQRPRRLRLSRLDDRKSQGADSWGVAQRCRDFGSRQLIQRSKGGIHDPPPIDGSAFNLEAARARANRNAPRRFAHHLAALAQLSTLHSPRAPRVLHPTRAVDRDCVLAAGQVCVFAFVVRERPLCVVVKNAVWFLTL